MSGPIRSRDFPNDLRRELKRFAAQTKRAPRAIIIEILEDSVKRKAKKRKR